MCGDSFTTELNTMGLDCVLLSGTIGPPGGERGQYRRPVASCIRDSFQGKGRRERWEERSLGGRTNVSRRLKARGFVVGGMLMIRVGPGQEEPAVPG